MRKFIFTLIAALFLIPSTASATGRIDHFSFQVALKPRGDDVNAFSAHLKVPSSWTIGTVHYATSGLVFWIQKPTQEGSDVVFSGVLPTGLLRLDPSGDPLLLFTVDLSGDTSLESLAGFAEQELYLNGPLALPAESARFSLEQVPLDINAGDALNLQDLNALHYSIEKDPVTKAQTLVVDNYQDNLAALQVEEKEGDFGFGAWLPVDGTQVLDSASSTVSLNVIFPDGTIQTVSVRNSPIFFFLYMMGGFLIVSGGIFLVMKGIKILKFVPPPLRSNRSHADVKPQEKNK